MTPALRAGHGDDEIPAGDGGERTEQHLEAGRAGVVAHEPLGAVVRPPIERPRRRHPPLLPARPAEILHQGEGAGDDDLEGAAGHDASSTTKRTRSPGASRAGGSADSSKRTASVVPSRCQPPGVARG